MMESAVSEYIRTMFRETRDGKLIIGTHDDQSCYLVEWDEEMAEDIAKQCCRLLAQLTEVGKHFDELRDGKITLSEELMAVWNAYASPTDDGDLDRVALAEIGKKQEEGKPLTPQELALADRADLAFRQDALRRLPYKRRMPIQLQTRAQVYANAVWMEKSDDWLLKAACYFAEEMVLYHCAKPFHICRSCRTLFYDSAKQTQCPECGYRLVKGVDF